MRNICLASIFIWGMTVYSALAYAESFPANQGDVIGHIKTAVVKPGDTLAQIARNYDMGYTEMIEANPGVDPDHLQPGTVVVIPSQFILPNAPRNGIVVNLAEMRLYHYQNGRVSTYPMGIGREGEDTPIGVLRVIQHIPNPTWTVPESIRKMRAEQGVYLPESVPPGPENPLGNYAMRLSNYTYLIHGTNDPLGGIGRRSSSGCLRMYPEDIQVLYREVSNGTNVYIVNEPYKAGWSQGRLYLESHISLTDEEGQGVKDADQIRNVVQIATRDRRANVNWNQVMTISSETQGLPQQIGEAAG